MCSHNQLSTRLACTAQVASVIQRYIDLILIEVLDITRIRSKIRVRLGQLIPVYRDRSTGAPTFV